MTKIKDAPRTATTMVVRSHATARITQSRDPYLELMRRLFQGEVTAMRAKRFLEMIEERKSAGQPILVNEWSRLVEELGVSRSSFYAMRNKLLGAGLLEIRGGEYHLSGQFSKDLVDMAKWWWVTILKNSPETL
ncbi:MAG: helix-turn-helix domain-containing protein [Euryarchaeota archaeon]|nr:helix-turn-helix domain-containing protein [Euryarchaeota archaeon]MDI6903569.1 hypothetical protein [Methanocellales archaeon]